jgi:hypothetical protein
LCDYLLYATGLCILIPQSWLDQIYVPIKNTYVWTPLIYFLRLFYFTSPVGPTLWQCPLPPHIIWLFNRIYFPQKEVTAINWSFRCKDRFYILVNSLVVCLDQKEGMTLRGNQICKIYKFKPVTGKAGPAQHY